MIFHCQRHEECHAHQKDSRKTTPMRMTDRSWTRGRPQPQSSTYWPSDARNPRVMKARRQTRAYLRRGLAGEDEVSPCESGTRFVSIATDNRELRLEDGQCPTPSVSRLHEMAICCCVFLELLRTKVQNVAVDGAGSRSCQKLPF